MNRFLKYSPTNLSLYPRLLLYFVLVSIAPLVLIGVVSYTISVNIIRERAAQFGAQMIGQVSVEINNLIADAYKVAGMVAEDPAIQAVLRNPLEDNISKRFSTDLAVDTRLNFIQNSYRNEFFGFYVIGANGGKYKSNFYSVKNGELYNTDWYHQIITAKEPIWFKTHLGSYAVETIGQSMVSVGFTIIDKATGNISGVVLIDIEADQLAKMISSRLGKTGYMLILDDQQQVICYPDLPSIPERITFPVLWNKSRNSAAYSSQDKIETGNWEDRSIIISKGLTVPGWKLAGVVPAEELTRDSRMMGFLIAGILAVICILALIAALTIAGSVANPIKKLISLMNKVEDGDLSVNMNVKYNDEIGHLGNSFNVMVGKIRDLMNRVYEEQQELRKTELKALQAQINPHFLYNTLDSIIWLARANRNDDVVTMVNALTKLFRIGISRGKDMITIEEELEHVENYLTIQQLRYKGKVISAILVPDELKRFYTLKLILQPIVENAIYHGIKLKREPGKITIRVREDEYGIIFEIEDTGIGMTPEKLQALDNTLKNAAGEKMESYGVKNVNERIKIYFGANYGLRFYSQYGVGTKVEIRIPKIDGEDQNAKSSIG